MSRKRVFTKPVAWDAKYKPAVRVQFQGKYQNDYFALRKIAEGEAFGITQTGLCRMILCEWVKAWRAMDEGKQTRMIKQLTLEFGDVSQKIAVTAGKAE